MTGSRKPGLATRLAYGVGGAAEGIKNNGFDYFLLIYYNLVLGVPASLVGAALLIALVFDAISDPVVGYFSDNLRTRFGRRHPFMYAALIPVALAYYFTWNPPAGLSGEALFPWLVAMTILVRLTFTLYEVPSQALAAELTQDYDARTSLTSFRLFFAWMGGLSIQILLLWFLLKDDFFAASGWHTYGLVASILIALAVLVCAGGTHRHIPHLKPPPAHRHLTLGRIFSEIFETVSNPSFRALFLGTLFGLLATGISASLNLYMNTMFWGFDPKQIAGLTLGVYGSALLALFIAPLVGRLFGKKRGGIAIGFGAFLIAPMPVFLRLAGWLPPNGTESLYVIILIVTIFDLALIIAFQMLMGAMVADIVEESELSTGRRSEGIFFAGISFIRKLSQGTGVMLAAFILSLASITRGMRPDEVPAEALQTLGFGYGFSLLAAWMLMLLCVSFYRISRKSHEANLSRLAAIESAAGQEQAVPVGEP